MSLKGILAIGGKPGLYKHVAQSKNSIIVEELGSGKRMPAYATSKISALEDIAIYTDGEEVQLNDVMAKLKAALDGGPIEFDPKNADPQQLKDLMEKVLPEYDRERVYVSDMKKMFSWYNILHEHQMMDFEPEEKEIGEEEKASEEVEEIETGTEKEE
ncbi:MAG: DUF5606 domain-containing protein [Bacteroidota bacterium]